MYYQAFLETKQKIPECSFREEILMTWQRGKISASVFRVVNFMERQLALPCGKAELLFSSYQPSL